uniref:Protein UL31 n=1 Tax=Cardioderma bat herpesvirus TaxID=3141914 RepID=A0AAU7E210_9VIRU
MSTETRSETTREATTLDNVAAVVATEATTPAVAETPNRAAREPSTEERDGEPAEKVPRPAVAVRRTGAATAGPGRPREGNSQHTRIIAHTPAIDVHDLWNTTLERTDLRNGRLTMRIDPFSEENFCCLTRDAVIRHLVDHYNASPITVHKASYRYGRVYLRVPVFDCGSVMEEHEDNHGWTNIILPKIAHKRIYFLLATLPDQRVTCQPVVTQGGQCFVMLVYAQNATSRASLDSEVPTVELVLAPFIPDAVPDHKVSFMSVRKLGPPQERRHLGVSYSVRRGDTILFVINNVVWEPSRVMSNGRRRITHYTAWFQGTWPGTPPSDDGQWIPCQNVPYYSGSVETSINVENVVYIPEGGKVLVAISTSVLNRITDRITPVDLPRSTALYITVYQPVLGKEVVLFNKNPKLFISGEALNAHTHTLNEPNLHELVVHAPHDISFAFSPQQTVRFEIIFQHEKKMFLISGLPKNNDFYTCMHLWRPRTTLRIVLWSHAEHLVILQGEPIAKLYCMDGANGNIHDQTEKVVFTCAPPDRACTGLVGDLELPPRNFPAFLTES